MKDGDPDWQIFLSVSTHLDQDTPNKQRDLSDVKISRIIENKWQSILFDARLECAIQFECIRNKEEKNMSFVQNSFFCFFLFCVVNTESSLETGSKKIILLSYFKNILQTCFFLTRIDKVHLRGLIKTWKHSVTKLLDTANSVTQIPLVVNDQQ